MVDTIESFVEKLQEEGVRAGQANAEKIVAEAQRQAQQIVEKAQSQAQQTLTDTQRQAEATLAKAQTELHLATRDTVLHLRDVLTQCLRAVLVGPVEQKLNDAGFLGELLAEAVRQYAQADGEGRGEMEIHVRPELHGKLAEWAISQLHQAAQTPSVSVGLKGTLAQAAGGEQNPAEHQGLGIDLKGTLQQAGFEYKVDGGTVEVTVDSVVELLAGMVGPRLREILIEAMEKGR